MSQLETRRILVIDDSRAIHQDFRKILAAPEPNQTLDAFEAKLFGATPAGGPIARQSYQVDSAYQGEEGVALVKGAVESGQRYPVAFIDMRMPPGWDGLRTIEKIWQVDPDVQVVICTAYSDYSWEVILARVGAGDRLLILKKPFDTAEVCQLACALTEKWHLARHAHLKLSQLRGMVQEQTQELQATNEKLLSEVERRKRLEERYSLAAHGANDGLWDWDLQVGTIFYSPRWKAMLGHDEGEVGDSPDEWMSRVHADDLPRLRSALDTHFQGKSDNVHCELRMRHRDGHDCWVLCRGIAVYDENGRATRAAGSLTNITDRKLAEEQLRFEALHDPLTGLGNRALLAERLEHSLARSKRDPEFKFAVLFIDLDHFKVINDSLGHTLGDKLLVGIAERLTACARKVDTIARVPRDHVARIGGDEFVILYEDLRDPTDAMRLAERLHAALVDPFSLDGHELFTFASIGVAMSDARYRTTEEILRDADTALYRAKESGKACTRIFDPEMHRRAMARWSIETDLRRAIERNELEIHYQPIVTAAGRLAAMEALVRWRHPGRGLVPPGDFIPIAEETNIIVPLGREVLRASCAQLREWQLQLASASTLAMGVNVSSKQFALPGFVDEVEEILKTTGIAPQCLKLEITETTAMQNAAQAIETVSRLRKMGVLIYMDDFGTGYSSLGQLHRMPIDALKIDRAFVSAMDEDAVSRSIVDAITALAHAMNMRVIAEGVETFQQSESLRKAGCDYLQGYFFSKPMPAALATAFIAKMAAQAADEDCYRAS